MATPQHSPRARGYQSWLGYWHHSNDYWSQQQESCAGRPMRDLWRSNGTFDGPATVRHPRTDPSSSRGVLDGFCSCPLFCR